MGLDEGLRQSMCSEQEPGSRTESWDTRMPKEQRESESSKRKSARKPARWKVGQQSSCHRTCDGLWSGVSDAAGASSEKGILKYL